MTTHRRAYYRKRLNKLLGAAKNEDFIQLLWATDTLQSDKSRFALPYLNIDTIPDGAATSKMTDALSIHKWEIETLANELMTVSKLKVKRDGSFKSLHCDNFKSIVACTNYLRKLENSEYRIGKLKEDIHVEMSRIAARQFEWQRGFSNIPQFFRNAFVYGQGESAGFFRDRTGVTIERFTQIGFMFWVQLKEHPFISYGKALKQLGVSEDEFLQVVSLIAKPFGEAAKVAQKDRREILHTADKPSILRAFPCLRFGKEGERIRAPLPDLILERITSGVFYDVVAGKGPVRDDYGKRFEAYCYRHLKSSLPNFDWELEYGYRKKPNRYFSPDVLGCENGKVTYAFECKATRMSHGAMFGKKPMVDRGYGEITKAVFQLWRFFSHSRRGYTRHDVDEAAVGIVLTLNNWLVMAATLREQVIKDAINLAADKDPEITAADRRPIMFVAAPEMERTLAIATEASFKAAVTAERSEKFSGWRLDGIHRELLDGNEPEPREYPFKDELGDLLPWWDELRS